MLVLDGDDNQQTCNFHKFLSLITSPSLSLSRGRWATLVGGQFTGLQPAPEPGLTTIIHSPGSCNLLLKVPDLAIINLYSNIRSFRARVARARILCRKTGGKLRCQLVGKHFIHSISEEVFSQEVSLNTENWHVAGYHGNIRCLVQFQSWAINQTPSIQIV